MSTSTRRLRSWPACLLAGLLTLTACGTPGTSVNGDGHDQVDISLVGPTWNAGLAALAVAERRGWFADENVDVDFVLLEGATIQAQQLATNNIDVAAATPEPVVFVDQPSKKLDLKFFSSFYRHNIYGLSVPADSPVKTLEDLRGRTIGAPSLGSSAVTNIQVALRDAGIGKNEATFVSVGTGGQQAAAVRNGDVDALALFDTQFQLLENNGIPLRRLSLPSVDRLFGGGLAATGDRLREDPDLFARIGRAVAKGVVFAQENPRAAIQDLYAAHPEARNRSVPLEKSLTDDTRVLEERMKILGVQPGEKDWGVLRADEVRRSIDFMARAGLIDETVHVDDVMDPSLISKINAFDHRAVREEARAAG
ncbi:ABC transporter substrate-binding protein [Streptomyces olivaceus]|uniref:ABC transporter substrate-binding protein n=1 Tax=Streptomyces olivaceus TaxID=47716 RepID=UPI00381D9BD6